MTTELYLPSNIRNLKDQKTPQFRIGLQGPPGTGKTTSALTFPNPLVLNYDAGLVAWVGKDLPEVPFYDEEYVSKELKCPPSKPNARANRKEALLKWLREHGLKMREGQTAVFDSWSSIQDAFDEEQALHPKVTKTGEIDSYDFWGKKVDYSQEVMNLICSMKCNVVVTFHEIQTRDPQSGKLLDKTAPLMQGKFVAELKRFFNGFFRMITEEKKNNKGQVIGCEYYWQVKSDNNFDAKNGGFDFPDEVFRIKPEYSELIKYKKAA
jgi:hypothetical protein